MLLQIHLNVQRLFLRQERMRLLLILHMVILQVSCVKLPRFVLISQIGL
ncbi:Uncharacterised protein [Mycobacterium tuberculosis]|nr:Uncharacterised protein [Mycobacterium tuberculosis]